jgi:hypothetical protein
MASRASAENERCDLRMSPEVLQNAQALVNAVDDDGAEGGNVFAVHNAHAPWGAWRFWSWRELPDGGMHGLVPGQG